MFLLLSGMLAIAPWLQWHRQQALCLANQPSSVGSVYGNGIEEQGDCPDFAPPTPWVHTLGVLSVACFAAFLFFTVRGVLERRREQALLRGAGVYVAEDELPLDD